MRTTAEAERATEREAERLRERRNRHRREVGLPHNTQNGALHPKEEAELKARARKNVEDDLNMLRAVAYRRTVHANKRIRYLGEYELLIVDQLREMLERVS